MVPMNELKKEDYNPKDFISWVLPYSGTWFNKKEDCDLRLQNDLVEVVGIEVAERAIKEARIDELQRITTERLKYPDGNLIEWDKISSILIEQRVKELENE